MRARAIAVVLAASVIAVGCSDNGGTDGDNTSDGTAEGPTDEFTSDEAQCVEEALASAFDSDEVEALMEEGNRDAPRPDTYTSDQQRAVEEAAACSNPDINVGEGDGGGDPGVD